MCRWCSRPFAASRVDARYCSTSHRQAAHRARIRRAELERDATPMRFAYADPPYIGKSSVYRGHRDYAGEVDHAELLSRLQRGYDGWALSCSAASLPLVCSLAVAEIPEVRVAVWTRSPRPHATARVLNAFEAVVLAGGRRVASATGTTAAGAAVAPSTNATTDVLSVTPRARTTHPGWLVGSKPPAFCEWVFDLLGAGTHAGDELDDLFPGSGIVARSWALRMGRDPLCVAGDRHATAAA